MCSSEFENLTVMEPKPRRKKVLIWFIGVFVWLCVCPCTLIANYMLFALITVVNMDISWAVPNLYECISLNLSVAFMDNSDLDSSLVSDLI